MSDPTGTPAAGDPQPAQDSSAPPDLSPTPDSRPAATAGPAVPVRRSARYGPGPRTVFALVGIAVVAVIAVVVALVGRSADAQPSKYSGADQPLRVFASVTPHAEILGYVKDKLAKGKFRLEIIEETDGVNGNDVVEHGDADANYMQHVPYLTSDTRDKGYTDLVVAATVHVEPYGIYSSKLTSLNNFPHHGRALLSNNVSNFARGLYLLQAAGLIRLDHQQGDATADALTITEKNIVDNPYHLTFTQLDPAQIPRSLPDATIGLINGNVALEAGLKPAKDALKLESGTNNPYANVLVAPKALRSDPRIRELSRILQGPQVAAFINTKYPGSVLPVGNGGK